MTSRDYVIQTHPCSEVLARGNLEAKGFEVYLPTVIAEVRTGPRRERRLTVMEPLFPSYLFVRMNLAADPWRLIGTARGVKRILGRDAEHPTPLPEGQLDELRARFAAGEFNRRVDKHRINAGDSVMIAAGAFEGHPGICTVARGERVKVLLTIMGAAREVNLRVETVMRAAQ